MTTEISSTDDALFAADVARRAGRLLLEVRSASTERGRELGRLGDGKANIYILDRLAAERPGDAVLSEESADDLSRLDALRVWIIDPLDGSREYGMDGRADWAVHVGLWEKGRGMTASAVGQPALDVVYSTADVSGPPPQQGRPKLVVSDSRPPYYMDALAAEVDGEVVTMGSAGAKTMAVVRGDVDAYVHSGGQWEWDSAAPVGVALAAGLHCSRIDGSPLLYNSSHPYVPDLLICRPELAEPLLKGIATHATREADSGRVAMAREYVKSLLSRDATKLRLAEHCVRVENGHVTGDSGYSLCSDIENGEQYEPITGIRELVFREWDTDVVARYLLDLDDGTTRSVTAHFDIPAGDIVSITAIAEPSP